MTDTFKAYLLRESDDRKVTGAFEDVAMSDLPEGDVTVRVAYSTVNYKDGMVMNGIGRLVRSYPHVPGVDFSGTVEASDNPGFKPGDKVVLTGWRVGEMHWGGYGELARVKGDWLVKLPDGLSLSRAMALGTAGFTAGLAVDTLEAAGMDPSKGEVLVTGAAGGVGSVAVALLAAKGYSVVAATGRAETHEYLTELGAASFIDRAELAEQPSRPLAKERFQAAIDNVAGPTLSNLLTQIAYGGSVAAVGLAGRQRRVHDGAALPAAWGEPARHRQRHVPGGAAAESLVDDRQHPAHGKAGCDQPQPRLRRAAGAGQGDPQGRGPRPCGGDGGRGVIPPAHFRACRRVLSRENHINC